MEARMTYKDIICESMVVLSQHPKTCVIGYNTKFGKAGGTLNGFPEDRLFEYPLAENLMAGAAVGMSLDGWLPILWIERMDFILPMMDSIYNHLARLNELSEGIHKPAAIIRVAVGNSEAPLFTGKTHVQDYSEALDAIGTIDVIRLTDASFIESSYRYALEQTVKGISTIMVEYRDRYTQEIDKGELAFRL